MTTVRPMGGGEILFREWRADFGFPDGTNTLNRPFSEQPKYLQDVIMWFNTIGLQGGRIITTLPMSEPGHAMIAYEMPIHDASGT